MNDKQIEIGHKILELLINEKGQLHIETIKSILKKEYDYDMTEIATLSTIMYHDYGLIRPANNIPEIKIITANGQNAYKIGLKQYITNFDNDKKLETDLAKSNIEANKINMVSSERNRKQNIFIICATILNLILLAIQLYIMSKSK